MPCLSFQPSWNSPEIPSPSWRAWRKPRHRRGAGGRLGSFPDQARAYLLDLLQGGGAKLHADYIQLVYDALHDLSEAPRISFGHNPQRLSGVALEMGDAPPAARRAQAAYPVLGLPAARGDGLSMLERYAGQDFSDLWIRVDWGPLLPQDRTRLVQQERSLVEAGIHSRRRAMERLGIADPESEQQTIRRESEQSTMNETT